LRPLAAVAAAVLLTVGCSSAAIDNGGTAPATREQALKFSACMREHGVTQFPDPDASGNLSIETVANGSSVDTNSPVFTQALSACEDLQPAGFTGYKRTPEQQKAALKFAQCIRDNGVKDFPDPAPDAPMIDTNQIPSTERSGGMAILKSAMEKCRGLAQDAGVSGGR